MGVYTEDCWLKKLDAAGKDKPLQPRPCGLLKQSTVSLQGRNSGEMITISGAPIEFAIAMPKNAENPALAKDFLDLMLSKKGQQILKDCGLITY